MSVAAAIPTGPSSYAVGQVYDIGPAALTIGTNVRLDTRPRKSAPPRSRSGGSWRRSPHGWTTRTTRAP